MTRLARVIIPGLPHLVTQRGNRDERVFFNDDDYASYRDLLSTSAAASKTQVWAWCLMPSHVHMILVPSHDDGLRQTMACVNRRYASRINLRNQWSGHLWQGRYGSVLMDEPHTLRAISYVLLNPVRAGLVERPQDWAWSSLGALLGHPDGLTTTAPVLARLKNVQTLLDTFLPDAHYEPLRRAEVTGRPVGSTLFLDKLERRLRRVLRPQKRGPKPKQTRTSR